MPRLHSRPLRLSVFAALLLTAAPAAFAAPRHLQLDASTPTDGARVESPDRIRLEFSQRPQLGATSIRLIDWRGEPVRIGDVAASSADPTVFTATVPAALPPARYTVAWRTMAADGHVIRGDFGFEVKGVCRVGAGG